ncbi:MAG: DUF1461 domain-containing protein, partial [Candidatus Aenigmatarchaeota archaeon]
MKLPSFPKYLIFLAVLKGIFVMSLILSLFLWSIPILAFNSDIWMIFQKRSEVALDLETAKSYDSQILDFFRTGLKLGFLNENELTHMEDVKTVITITNIVFGFSFVSLLTGFSYLSRSQKKFLLNSVQKTSVFVFVITLILATLVLTNFQTSFLSFHKIFFVKNFIFPADGILKT